MNAKTLKEIINAIPDDDDISILDLKWTPKVIK